MGVELIPVGVAVGTIVVHSGAHGDRVGTPRIGWPCAVGVQLGDPRWRHPPRPAPPAPTAISRPHYLVPRPVASSRCSRPSENQTATGTLTAGAPRDPARSKPKSRVTLAPSTTIQRVDRLRVRPSRSTPRSHCRGRIWSSRLPSRSAVLMKEDRAAFATAPSC